MIAIPSLAFAVSYSPTTERIRRRNEMLSYNGRGHLPTKATELVGHTLRHKWHVKQSITIHYRCFSDGVVCRKTTCRPRHDSDEDIRVLATTVISLLVILADTETLTSESPSARTNTAYSSPRSAHRLSPSTSPSSDSLSDTAPAVQTPHRCCS